MRRRLDDLILRMVVHHLVLEMGGHSTDQQTQPDIPRISQPNLDSLCDWIDTNSHPPLKISDLEQRPHDSRRSFQRDVNAASVAEQCSGCESKA